MKESRGKDGAQRTADVLGEGKLVVALMSKGHFTEHGHFSIKEASRNTAAEGPFWIVG